MSKVEFFYFAFDQVSLTAYIDGYIFPVQTRRVSEA